MNMLNIVQSSVNIPPDITIKGRSLMKQLKLVGSRILSQGISAEMACGS